MAATSRELVLQCLNFENPSRVPRQLWHLPWAKLHYPEALQHILETYPDDMTGPGDCLNEYPKEVGEAHTKGIYVDPWGCTFVNLDDGYVGEVKDPIIKDWETDTGKVHIPREWLTVDVDKVNRFCGASDKFVTCGACARPFERLQFLRGTVPLYMDLLAPPKAMQDFIREMHAFYCEQLSIWAKTDVDALNFMDDWGSQNSLLINPELWRDIFKPLYRDYVDIAHSAGKKVFMHSDGYIADIYPDLIELGVDAVNSQIFCMGVDALEAYAGQITFWGEIDRQHILRDVPVEEVTRAVDSVYNRLWKNGGCIAQCEFSVGARPENVSEVFRRWNEIHTAL